ncbi:VWA domain-containing protein [Ilumatobacter sp.]|uniref:VWA domain-containing protein n=1 Tax=Ilumatobacter sp. TaxID=1967498 RepID=UPI003B525C09
MTVDGRGGATDERVGDGDGIRTVSEAERRRRWRLVLGGAAEVDDPTTDGPGGRPPGQDGRAADGEGEAGTGPGAARSGPDGSRPDGSGSEAAGSGGGGERGRGGAGDDGSRPGRGGGTGRRGPGLDADDARIDAALGALYDRDPSGDGRRRAGSSRAGGLGRSRPGVVRWLGDIRRYFPSSIVRVLQRDAVERLDLRQLMLEPELLQALEPDISLVTVLVELNRVLPDETRASARAVIATVVADVEARLEDQTRQAVRGALARGSRTRRPRPGDIDWPRTIEANLRHWIPEHRTLVPERLVGHGRRRRSLAKDVIIAVDQSGSMADSVVYASLFAGVLARLPTLSTHLYAFDTSITDLTGFLHDPVEVLFGVQLGGGTDIASALTFCARRIERPRDTVLFVVSDLFEGGDGALMRRRIGELVDAGVTVVVLLALSDEGAPAHDHDHAAALADLGAVVTSTTPDAFPDVLAQALAR